MIGHGTAQRGDPTLHRPAPRVLLVRVRGEVDTDGVGTLDDLLRDPLDEARAGWCWT